MGYSCDIKNYCKDEDMEKIQGVTGCCYVTINKLSTT